ncbi:MAG: dihydrofolate reductase [Opitutales bacterium]|nr:dihydrofolate reductase [Opitutales bacterium]
MEAYKNWRAIAAVAQNGVIGRGLEIPWHISEDFKHFKRTTLGGVVVFGRRTWESFGFRALPGRENAVISATCPRRGDAKFFNTLAEFEAAYKNDSRNVWICGGAGLYKSALPLCSEIILSRVKMKPEGDVFFPDISNDFMEKETLLKSEMFDVIRYARK